MLTSAVEDSLLEFFRHHSSYVDRTEVVRADIVITISIVDSCRALRELDEKLRDGVTWSLLISNKSKVALPKIMLKLFGVRT